MAMIPMTHRMAAVASLAASLLAIIGCGGDGPARSAPREVAPRAVAEPISETTGKGARRPFPWAATAEYVGSESCRSCHGKFYDLWADSWHGLAMQTFTPEFAERELPGGRDAAVSIGASTYRVAFDDQGGRVVESGPEGEKSYEMVHVLGGKNTYYLLTPLEKGRLQVLPIAYDVHAGTWYDTAASGVRHFPDREDEALHWTDRMFTFNTTCFNCHVSNLATSYDLASDTYHTTWGEPGISCETCHGPAGDHVQAMMAGAFKPGDEETSEAIRIIRTAEFTADQMNDSCATCHAKMVPLSTAFLPGDRFFDHYDLIGLEHPDYYPDGRDLGENYTFTSWLMSPCITKGTFDCNHCHTSSGRMKFSAETMNHSCLPCHEQHVADPASHSHHAAGTPGGGCIDCHMPKTRFAAMNRTDHSMLPPTPAATIAHQSPNACTMCHMEEGASWADEWVRKWYPDDYQAPVLERARLVQAARTSDWSALPDILAYLRGGQGDPVTRASLARLMEGCPDEQRIPALVALLKEDSPLVRAGAASAIGGTLDGTSIAALLEATRDEVRLVRIRAAMSLAPVRPEQLPDPRDRESLRNAIAEFEAAMKARPDDWASYANLGNFHMERGDFSRAAERFAVASTLEPRAVGPWTNAAIAYSNLNRPDEAERCLRAALEHEPTNAAVQFNLGLLLGERGQLDEAKSALRAALEADPNMAQAAYNLGILLADSDLDEAVSWCRKAHELRPGDPRYAHVLAYYLRRKGDADGAITVLRPAITANPSDVDCAMLLSQILAEDRGDPRAAAGVLRDLATQPGTPAPLVRQLATMISRLEAGAER